MSLSFVSAARAQTDSGRAADFRLSAGVVALDVGGVQSLLAGQGFVPLRSRVPSVGPHLTFNLGPARLGILAHAFLPTTQQQGTLQLVTSGGVGMVELGLPIVRSTRLSVTPVVGIGAGVVRLELTSRDQISLDSLIRDPRQDVRVSGRTVTGQAGMAMEGTLPFGRRGRMLTLSLDAGVVSPLSRTHWRRAYDAVNEEPRASMHGGYARFGVGLTGSRVSDGLVPTLLGVLAYVSGR